MKWSFFSKGIYLNCHIIIYTYLPISLLKITSQKPYTL